MLKCNILRDVSLFAAMFCQLSFQCEVCYLPSHRLSSFDGKAVSDFPLASQEGLWKLWQCTRMCSEDRRCRSYRYNHLTGVCSTYGVGYSLPGNTFNPVTMEAGSQLYLMCNKTQSFGVACTSTEDCDFPNSDCSESACTCGIGYIYDATAGACVDKCTTYGDTFVKYADHGLYGCNTAVAQTNTIEECMEACRNQNTFTCVSVERQVGTTLCNMCYKAWFELDDTYWDPIATNWNLYQRNCAF